MNKLIKFDKPFNVLKPPEQGLNVPIKLWLSEIGENALEQLYNVARLPFIFKHLAVMPDSHLGFGMPIGGVAATQGYIIPNAVGVDIGCLDCDSEYLTQSGWKKMSEWRGEEILQYNKNTDMANFVMPSNYIVDDCDLFFHLKSKKGIDQMLSEDHKILYWHGYKNRGYIIRDHITSDFVEKHNSLKKGMQGGIKTTFNLDSEKSMDLTEQEIRIMVMISADGSIRKRKTVPNKVEIHLKKKRKIKRAKTLLEEAGISFKLSPLKDNSTNITFISPLSTKDLSIFWSASKDQLQIIADECLNWDGHKGDHHFYSTTSKNNADLIQFAFATNGIRCGIYNVPSPPDKNWSECYNVYLTKNQIVNIPRSKIKKVSSVDGKKYCFTVPSGYFIARRNGKIFITGNCGMASIRTNIRHLDIDTRKKIMGDIRRLVPVSYKHHKTPQEGMPDWTHSSLVGTVIDTEYESAKRQLGTLGGGNHFIELQMGSDGFVYIMIHSGSRNLGKKVADHYNKLAVELNEKWFSQVPKKYELAFLPLFDAPGQNYLNEMNYCVRFAAASRALMMSRVREAVSNHVEDVIFYYFDLVDVAHNYARMENHFGTNVMVHRKGATAAYTDQLGVIPGSQGTSSYVVRGKGNRDSFMSCSHGAGRVLGRKQAQKTLNLEDEIKMLDDQGIIHGIRKKDHLEEATGAYKDIKDVMKHQENLVDIIVELKPLAVVKG